MSEFRYLTVDLDRELAVVTLMNPPMNPLNMEFLIELDRLNDYLNENKVRVVIYTGSGRAFIAGADIAEMKDMNPDQALRFSRFGQSVFAKIEKSDIVSIAAINGYALGGGLEFTLACGIRIASEKAKFAQPETSLGIIPGFGGTFRLADVIPKSYANLMILSGRMIDAQEAYRIGLIDILTTETELMETAKGFAIDILAKSPAATKLAKHSIEGHNGELESKLFSDCFICPDQKEGMNAFLEKRKANF